MTKIFNNRNWFLLMAIATFLLLLWQWRAQDELWQLGVSAFLVAFWLFRYLAAPPPRRELAAVVNYLVKSGTPRRALDIANATGLRLGGLYVTLHYLEKKELVKRIEGDDPSLAFYTINNEH